MITYMPEIYPDELVYSWFCRYYMHTGFLTHKTALQEILYNRCNNPSKEFLGHLNPEMVRVISRMYPIEELVLEHTMFPQYARFIPAEQKKRALHHICYDFCDAHHLFAILPRSENDIFMKYCPVCTEEDRLTYGEAYWHRTHQLRNVQVCPKHSCMLVSSTVTAKSEQTFTLCPAETHVLLAAPIQETDPHKLAYAKYITDVFAATMDFEKDIPISAVLYAGMRYTQYMKSSGKSRYTKQLAEDVNAYYAGLGVDSIASIHQIQRVLLSERFDFSVVCQIAFFLGMKVSELTTPILTADEIAQEQSIHYMKDRTPIDWAVYDEETAPLLDKVAGAIYDGTASEIGRPERVSYKAIYREMDLPAHRLDNLPKCRAILERYSESYEENWARRLIWAYNKLVAQGKLFYWSDIRKLSGVKKHNLDKVMPFLHRHTDTETIVRIVKLVEGK